MQTTAPLFTLNREVPIGYLAANGAELSPADSLERAVELLQTARSGAVPVMEGGYLRGLVSDREVAAGLTADGAATVGAVMTRDVPIAAAGMPADDALRVLSGIEFPALPVVSPDGRFLGTVGRGELLAALFRRRRPNPVGGMATPLGVYLSDGNVRGGVGSLGLALTGVFLMFGWLFSTWLGDAAAGFWRSNGLSSVLRPDWIAVPVFLAAFAAWFRLSPVAGYHAAEHQTVHAIERNEPLTLETVAGMPRPHPRCGTNLVALSSMFTALIWGLRADPVVAGLASIVTYRFFGHWIQQHVTTRPANRKQLESGIAAGNELLERFQAGVAPSSRPGLRRLWNTGIVQVGIGYAAAYAVLMALGTWVPFVRGITRFLQ